MPKILFFKRNIYNLLITSFLNYAGICKLLYNRQRHGRQPCHFRAHIIFIAQKERSFDRSFYIIFSTEYMELSTAQAAGLAKFIVHQLTPASSYSRTSFNLACALLASSNHTSCRTPLGSV